MVRVSANGKEALDAFAAAVLVEKKLPTFIASATNVDGEIYSKSGGRKVVKDPNSGVVDLDGVWWLYSQTKMITHLATLQLIERLLLDPSAPVSTFFPTFANPIILEDVSSDESSY
ncbi:unnamed protein product [Cyclocybe aegerita]|uniref:Beta-lactamase-related domain-containing protein n=1 Tax=Cyclocybe aegerita TaxID=1973307 RepID=A0A8S0WHX0_CYCAE|nr:unnamed protein product [Cyclocybe aegerita]